MTTTVLSLCLLALCLATSLHGVSAADTVSAVAIIKGTEAAPGISGTVVFTTPEAGKLTIQVNLAGLAANAQQGLHIHTYGDVTDWPAAGQVGSHYNPANVAHGLYPAAERHPGDLGNVQADANGNVALTLSIDTTVLSMQQVIGRTVILHADADNGGQPTGNAGPKAAFGVIGLKNPGDGNTNSAAGSTPNKLVCYVQGFDGVTEGNGVNGVVLFTLDNGKLRVQARINGLAAGKHGLHVHTYGDWTPATGSQFGPHWAGTTATHGLPCTSTSRHQGDYGNIEATAGNPALYDFTTEFTSTDGLAGRGCVLHLGEDLGTGASGDAGTKVAGGVIGVADDTKTIDVTGVTPMTCPAPTPTPSTTPSSSGGGTAGAVALLRRLDNNALFGTVTFTPVGTEVQITTSLINFPSGPDLGIHVHEYAGAARADLGGHFNPLNVGHALPPAGRHVGDLGNTNASRTWMDGQVKLDPSSLSSIIGRSILIHSLPDTGDPNNLGPGLATGTIGILTTGVTAPAAVPILVLRANLFDLTDQTKTYGYVEMGLAATNPGHYYVKASVSGLTGSWQYGFHIHTYGAEANGGSGLGPHYALNTNNHGRPCDLRHTGDLGNLATDSTGQGLYYAIFPLPSEGAGAVNLEYFIGRAFVLHASNDKGTGASGDAGVKLAAGVIGRANPTVPLSFPTTMTLNYNCVAASNTPAATTTPTPTPAVNPVESAAATFVAVVGSGMTVTGSVTVQVSTLTTVISGSISGLTAGSSYGFHIHEYGDIASDASKVGGHYNPYQSAHGLPPSTTRHVGDLGNIVADANGVATVAITVSTSPLVRLSGSESVIGRAFVIHAGADSGVQPTGGAGSKVAMAAIGLKNEGRQIGAAAPGGKYAVCRFNEADGVTGDVWFTQTTRGVRVQAVIKGLSSGEHALHVHEFGELASIGSHYNPDGSMHGLGCSYDRHQGDLGNLKQVKSGAHMLDMELTRFITLDNHIGRACAIHAGADQGSQPTGNAGSVQYKAVVGRANTPADIATNEIEMVQCEKVRISDARSAGKSEADKTTTVAVLATVLVLVTLVLIGAVVFFMGKLKEQTPRAKGMEQL